MSRHPTRSGAATSPTSGHRGNGITWLSCWIFVRAGWWTGRCQKSRTLNWLSGRWIWLTSNEEDLRVCCFTRIKGPVCESFISPAAVALSHAPEHESPGKLLGLVPVERVFQSLKTEWMPTLGYRAEAQRNIRHFLMHRYYWIRPHQFNDGLAPARAEEKLNVVSGIS